MWFIITKFPYVGFILSALFCIFYLYHIIKSSYDKKKYGIEPVEFISVKNHNRAILYSSLFIISWIIFIVINPAFGHWIGYRNLNFEDNGRYTYYVELHITGSNKTDIVPAQILKDQYGYHIEKLALPNGDTADLLTDYDGWLAEIDEYTYVTKDDGLYEDEWAECKLLNEHALYPSFVDNSGISLINVALILLDTITTFFTVYTLFRYVSSNNTPTEQVK